MIKKLIHNIARPRHPWRKLKFDELAEIYTSVSIRSFGFGIIGIFVPIFLFKSAVSLRGIFLFYLFFFFLRIPVAYIVAFIVGRIGPKHTIAISTVVFIMFLMLLLTYEVFGWPLLFMSLFYTTANGLFFISYNTDFSKIKDSKNGGKELGWLYIFERAGTTLGPLFGGVLASFVSPELTIFFAILILFSSLIPLFLTNEPTRIHQKITFKGFKWHRHKRDFISLSAYNIENFASQVVWPLLVGVLVFTDDTYAKVGAIIALGTGISMFSAYMFGKFIDNKKGLILLRYGTIMNAITHAIRSTVTAAGGAIAISALNEPITLSYRMPLVKGFYDAADSEEGYRIVYLVVAEMLTALAKGLFCLLLLVASYVFDPVSVLRYCFILVGILSLGILLQRFPALKK